MTWQSGARAGMPAHGGGPRKRSGAQSRMCGALWSRHVLQSLMLPFGALAACMTCTMLRREAGVSVTLSAAWRWLMLKWYWKILWLMRKTGSAKATPQQASASSARTPTRCDIRGASATLGRCALVAQMPLSQPRTSGTLI